MGMGREKMGMAPKKRRKNKKKSEFSMEMAQNGREMPPQKKVEKLSQK